jgi:oxygen-dependent protoporphyrinogen oxidase
LDSPNFNGVELKSIGTAQVNVQERNPRLGHHAVIVGGGISGLSTAFFLSQKASREHVPLKITVLEASNRWGGILRTLSCAGLQMEAGADAFYAGQKDTLDLCGELGLQGDVVEAAACFRHFFGLQSKRLFPIPNFSGSFLETVHLLNHSHLSFSAKCRMLGEPFIPPRKEKGDESFASFICRRLGPGFYQEIAKPLVQGVYMMDPERLSLETLFPRLQQAERVHRSLAGSFWSEVFGKKKKGPLEFFTLKQGLERLVQALVRELGKCDLRTSTRVRQCVNDGGWKISLEDGTSLDADILCLAMGACDSSKLLSGASPELSRELSSIQYDSIAVVNLIYRSEDIPAQGRAPGFLVPMGEGSYPFSSLKWLGRAADGQSFSMRAFLSEAMIPEIFNECDEVIEQKIMTFLSDFLGIHAKPLFVCMERYPHSLPQYEIGHLERVARIEKQRLQYPGLLFAGNGFRGFGITGCIRQAKAVVSNVQLPIFGNHS